MKDWFDKQKLKVERNESSHRRGECDGGFEGADGEKQRMGRRLEKVS